MNVRPASGRARDPKCAVERLDAVGETAQPGSIRRIRAADAVVVNVDHGDSIAPRDIHFHAGGVGVLCAVRERLGDEEIHCSFNRLPEPRLGWGRDRDWNPGALGQRSQGGGETLVGKDRRVDAPCKLS